MAQFQFKVGQIANLKGQYVRIYKGPYANNEGDGTTKERIEVEILCRVGDVADLTAVPKMKTNRMYAPLLENVSPLHRDTLVKMGLIAD